METSSVDDQPPQHQVFISFRGADLRLKFVSHLVKDLKWNNINVFIDEYEKRGQPIDILLKRIEESKIVLVIFSSNYTNSLWCVRELEKIKDCTDDGTLVAIPIFYKLEPSTVRDLKGKFGDSFRSLAKGDEKEKKWKEAFNFIPNIMGITIDKKSVESEKVNDIVKAVKTALTEISLEGREGPAVEALGRSIVGTSSSGCEKKHKTFGNGQRLKELEEKLDLDIYKKTRIIGVVGMPGIGKTTLLKELYKTWQGKFTRHALIDQIRVKLKHLELGRLPQMLLGELSKLNNPHMENFKDPYSQLHERKVLVVLDDVSKRGHIDALREILDWIKEGKEGSRVVIATSDMSLTNGLVDDTYMVPNLNHRDSLQLFRYHAFNDDQANPRKKDFMKLSEGFVHYARGHPLALKVLGGELNKKSMDHWNSKLKRLAQSPSPNIVNVFQVSYDELTSEQKDAFLDIACFRSQDKDYVESLLASSELRSAEGTSAVKALTDKFLINTCDGRVEMHDLLYTFSRELDLKTSSQDDSRQQRLWFHQHIIKGGIINVLQNKMKPANVRGIFLDLSEVKHATSLDRDHFISMRNLRYLKFYNSHCPQECKTNNKINIPDKLKLPLKEVRCLHWLKFPLEELPNDFNPINLVDLKLPYSEIEQLWEGDKDTPFLKWVDLSHSTKLCSLSGLSKAEKLKRLNLEGCTTLKTLPHDMERMKMLDFLNLKGCTRLEYLPEMNLVFLKTLTLSGCSTFNEFPLISENLETLYIDGTAISQLPANMEKLQRLVVLNMKDCKMLEEIPGRVCELKALQELILSDCSNLKIFPEINISSLKILLLDGTAIEVMPQLPSLQYLCVSRNTKISCLPAGISQLSQLKWLDLKYCTSLTSVPEFPPNLQCLDAHGCSSLKTVSKPLARIMPTEQNHSTYIFTNCENLEQVAKEEITSYAQRKCQLLSYARKRYNGGLVSESLFSTCFPGCEVPSWFCHETVGSELEVKLLPHWHDKKLAGIALCAVVSSLDDLDQISSLSVICTFKVKDEDKSWVPFTCPVGSWTRHRDKKDKIESDHVFIGYTSCPHTIKCPEDGNSDECNPTEASLEFTVTGGASENGKFKVLKCGLSLVYANDKNKNSSHEAKYDMLVGKSLQENSDGVDGRVNLKTAMYSMAVMESFQENSEGVYGRVKRKKKTRKDNGRIKKKQRSGIDKTQTVMKV
ncbi:PREDICTED: disease resistance protein RPS4-like [Camelina sativa]|uniref:ADP-ribosyl cyclase/cyclic ADP-ribose hydrolase n=1 Tax=Camelina sativa TaxID=90675 RepID=A0ABM0X6W1_CAMSA|nr:PREDICTED: disease resistance protein RPS4-like [Camelina sativa]